MTQPLLPIEEVAQILAVSTRTVWRLVAAGHLPPPVKVGRRLRRWRAADIENYIQGKPQKRPRR